MWTLKRELLTRFSRDSEIKIGLYNKKEEPIIESIAIKELFLGGYTAILKKNVREIILLDLDNINDYEFILNV